jgi:archaellum biogenesis ATPase FlaH
MDELEKNKLIKDALNLVDKLASMDIDDDSEEIDELIEKARKLKKNRLWILK